MRTREALAYPLRGPNNESAVLVGFVLGFLVAGVVRFGSVGVLVAVAPSLLLLGFVGRIVERSLDGDPAIPGYQPVSDVLKRGVRLGIVALVYAIPPVVVLVGASTVFADMAATGLGSGGGYAFLALSTGLLVVWGAFGYVIPAAMISVVRTGSLRSMLALGTIRDVIGRESYLVTWIKATLLFGFTASLAVVLLRSDQRTGLVAIPMVVYVLYVSGHMLAVACTKDNLWS